ncbi:unnamed protein product [Phaedon cochleariae]|uniref:Vitellogenin n=1 Tax=Phaedon cochleariae TaxID=80249 RepID=A0A9N9SBR8_PHACE|nr:unnamed protein product [Phaedon cochleariae]
MWSQIVLCMLVGFAYASNISAWKDNTEYVYQVRGRTMASLHDVSNQYSGILTRAFLRIQLRPDGKLQALITEPEYSHIHSQLHDGWKTYIPDAELTWKPLEMSSKPIQLEMKQGIITDIIVNKDIQNWEANMIKSIISQFQLNLGGNGAYSKSQEQPAVFKVLEDTVTGNTETLYEIREVPEYLIQNDEPWQQRLFRLKGEGEIIEVLKHKNYANNVELPSYFFGFGEMREWNAATNQMGEFFLRDSTSRALITGDRQRFTIHNSYTVNKIMINPTLTDQQKGSVVSMMNVTLEEVKSQSQIIEDVLEPVRLGNLVYTYEKPFSPMSQVSEKRPSKYEDREIDSKYQRESWNRLRRSFDSSEENASPESEENYKQDQPQMSQAPASPFLPYTTGYKGKCLKHTMNLVKSVSDLAREIGNELQNPRDILRQQTLSKFTSMASLIRVMSEEDLLKLANELYTTAKEGEKHAAWVVLRDGFAEAGTGPAFLVIEKLIQARKIKGLEASQIISSMTDSVRQPTFQYIKSYFELIKKEEVRSQWPLNDTALLSFTELVSRVYFDEEYYKNQFPIKAFTQFYSEEGKKFIRESVIPYLGKELQEAISKAETHKIHAYIRALGNIGDASIMTVFEPYLEGQKKASQYQRLLMVISMDRLVKTNPEVVREVCFKIYQNTAETEEVRIAAVYRLMASQPSTDMLQLMASYTHVDKQEHVNAVVKSAIERFAELEGDELYKFRLSAEAARPLLTKKTYGFQYGGKYLREHMIHELNQHYSQMLNIYGSKDSYFPKGFEYILNSKLDGFWKPLMHVQAYVSSLDEMIRVGKEQTNSFKDKAQRQEQNAEEQRQNPWSSRNVAQLLNMKSEISEQLEGSIYNMLPGSPLKMLSFDNKTIERFPEVIRQFQDEFKNGKKIDFHKILNNNEMALAFPTEMGLPFVYTYDMPMLFQVQGELKIVASPDVSRNGQIYKPDSIRIQSDMGITVTAKMQGRLGFTTPFDHQQYIAGFDKQFQIHVPVHGNIDIDIKNGKVNFEFEAVEKHEGAHVFHYSTWPYTSRVDILNLKPLHLQPNTHVIRQQKLRHFDEIIGQKQWGMAFHVQIEHERQTLETPLLKNLFNRHGFFAGLMGSWNDATIQYSKFSVSYLPKESSTRKIVMRFGYQNKYNAHPDEVQRSVDWTQLRESSDAETLREKIMSKVAEGITNVKVEAVDASAELQGDKTIKFLFGAGYGKSVVDPKSRTLVYWRMTSDDQEFRPYEMTFESKGYIPNTNALDLEFALKHEPRADVKLVLAYGPMEGQKTRIQTDFEYSRSEDRKQYLKQLPLYQQCKHEMREGNKQSPACTNMTLAANLLDHTTVKVQYENVKPFLVEAFRTAYDALRVQYLPDTPLEANQLFVRARFHPDFKFVNVTVESKDEKTEFRDIAANDWARQVFVVHPVFHLPSRMMGQAFGLQTYRPMCVVDQTQANTFNNRSYPVELSKEWTVMLQYIPEVARRNQNQGEATEQIKRQLDNFIVLVRQSTESSEKKDVKIVISTPETESKTLEITMTPSSHSSPKPKATVTVNKQQVEISEDKSYDSYNGFVQIYALPNGEVKCEVQGTFYIIYDGSRARLTVLDGKFRDDVRGLCGRFNDEKIEDMTAPENCIARDWRKFAKSFEVQSQEGKQVREEFSENKGCAKKQYPLYFDVVSEDFIKRGEQPTGTCSITQTRYVQQNGEICFTTRALLSCRSQCQVRGWVTKNVPVHCIPKSNVAQLWKNQIDMGASPDFSHKKEHKRIDMQVPQSCSE